MLDAKERAFYEEKVCLSHARAKQICLDTANQDGTLWQSERKKELLEVFAGSCTRSKRRTNARGLQSSIACIVAAPSQGTKQPLYGRDNEPVALEEYETVHQAKVGRLGLVVAPEVPWLGYSPDGVSSQGNRRVLIEAKCPMLGKETA
ncbi:hypothetical protein HPB48_000485 [Haemaphysalis longicornis]|uniref:YqaJ viral recombinase domain-containing protein n=1 Tax=Haemaphysalis longicornis TaxID=44386 RepID=A0A9J6GUE7_HAELO|nr:hypothetical protein HPB48_000485 [Haemaphysalis longicornis]